MKQFGKFLALFLLVLLLAVPTAGAEQTEWIVRFEEGFIPSESCFEAMGGDLGYYLTKDFSAVERLREHVLSVKENQEIRLIEGEKPFVLSSSLPETACEIQWQLGLIHANYPWEMETYGNEINVAVIDTGCNPHSDLGANLAGGYNYITGSKDFSDDVGHGTHVCGVIGALLNWGGVTGVAPKVNIYALRCFGKNISTKESYIYNALVKAVDEFHCRVINMSFGEEGYTDVLKDGIDYAASKGAILVAAVGNDGDKTNAKMWPAAFDNVIGVGSVDEDKQKSWFSRANDSVFVVAPGNMVLGLSHENPDGGVYYSGTSQASPMVAGLAALALSVDETITAERFRQLLIDTSEDLGDEKKFGNGLINCEAFTKKLMAEKPYYVSPINLSEEGKAYVLIRNNGEQTLTANALLGEYKNSALSNCTVSPLSVPAGETTLVTAASDYQDGVVKHFLWDGMVNLMPLTVHRENTKAR